MSAYHWSEKRLEAALLVASDQLTDVEICAKVGISDRQLRRWKHIPEFQARVEEHIESCKRQLRRHWDREMEVRLSNLMNIRKLR